MSKMDKLIYLNGKMVTEEKANVSIFDIGFMYGATFMEAVRTFNHEYFKLSEHLERLEKSLIYAGIGSIFNKIELESIMNIVLETNTKFIDKEDDSWVCINVTPGIGFPHPLMKQKSSRPTIVAYSSELPYEEYYKYYSEGKSAITPNIRNIPPQCMDPRCKTRSRFHYFIAKREALTIDPGSFAILLDINGNITESSGSNFFIVSKNALYTADRQNILNGISRQTVIELACEIGVPVYERDISLYDVYSADEAFFTTTSYCMLPVSRLNGISIGNEIPGCLTKRLLCLWSEKVGVDIVGQAEKFGKMKEKKANE